MQQIIESGVFGLSIAKVVPTFDSRAGKLNAPETFRFFRPPVPPKPDISLHS